MKVEFYTNEPFEKVKRKLFDTFPNCSSVVFDGKEEPRKWISVEDRLPKSDYYDNRERKRYLVFNEHQKICYVATYGYKTHDWWVDNHHCVLDNDNVTHWQPLPQPPKESE